METKEIEKRISELRGEREKYENEYIAPLLDAIRKLKTDRLNSILKNKEYISDLSEYEGKHIESITAISSTGEKVWEIPTDEILTIENGRLHASSFNGGIVKYSEQEKCYERMYHFSTTKLDIVGFIDIVLDDEE